jgi:hypothetical protein
MFSMEDTVSVTDNFGYRQVLFLRWYHPENDRDGIPGTIRENLQF